MAELGTPAERVAGLVAQASQPDADLLAIAAELQRLAGEFAGTRRGQRDAVAAQSAAVSVLRLPQANQDLVAEQATRLAEYVHTLAARRNDAGDPAAAVTTAREALARYQSAAQVAGVDLGRVTGQLTALSKLCSWLGIPDAGLAATQLAVGLLQAMTPMPPSPEQQLTLADLQQNLAARYFEVHQVDQAGLTGQVATQSLYAAAQTVWSQVGEHARALTALARDLLAGGLPMPAAAVLRAAQAAMQDPPVLLDPGSSPAVDETLPASAVPHVTAVGERKDLLRRIADSGSALGAVLAGGGLGEAASTAQALLTAYTPGRFCATPDPEPAGGGIQLLIFGEVHRRWPTRQSLRVSINPAGCQPPTMAAAAAGIIAAQFAAWAAAILGPAGPIFSFAFVAPGANEDIDVTFRTEPGDTPTFGRPGNTAGLAEVAPSGSIRLDPSETWNPGFLASITLHEVGHMLGLAHSSAPGSIMYPYAPNPGVVDPESIQALQLAYAPGPQQRLSDRGTSHRPAMSSTRVTNFTGAARTVHMAWKGASEDQGIYHAELGASWSGQDKVPRVGTSRSPALVEVGPLLQTQLLMAWKGVEDDQGLYWTKRTESGWERQRAMPGRGSAEAPALCSTPAGLFLAWRGVAGDQGLYTSVWDGAEGWSSQVGPIAGRGSSHTPALAVLNGRLYMFWKGIEGDTSVYWSLFDLTLTNPIWTSQKQVTWDSYETGGAVGHAIGSTTGPVATTRGNNVLLAWKGAKGDSQIWLSLFDGTSFTGQMPIHDAGTSYGPGLVDVGGTSFLAWKGIEGDSTIWWKSV